MLPFWIRLYHDRAVNLSGSQQKKHQGGDQSAAGADAAGLRVCRLGDIGRLNPAQRAVQGVAAGHILSKAEQIDIRA